MGIFGNTISNRMNFKYEKQITKTFYYIFISKFYIQSYDY